MNEPEFKKYFGKRVKELRLKNGLTQEQLAEMIDVGERNLSKIECGNVFVKAKTISKLIEALKVEPKELFEFSPYQKHETLKQILIDEINSDNVDIELLYKLYRAIKYWGLKSSYKGNYSTAWVIQNGNLDYLKCPEELNWETQTSCK